MKIKITKWDCNSTGISIGKTNCRVRSLSRFSQAVTWEFQINQKVSKVLASYRSLRRHLNGDPRWRLLIKIDGIDACAVLKGAKSMPLVNAFYNMYKQIFPNLPQRCPIKPGNYSAKNVEMKLGDNDDMNKTAMENQGNSFGVFKEMLSKMTPQIIPNGFYKNVLQFSSESGILTLSYVVQFDYRMSEDNFK